MATATEQKPLTDEQLEKELKDLTGKTDVTPEEKEKLSTLKEERQTRYQKKIDKMHSENLAAKNRSAQLEKELADQKAETERIRNENQAKAKPRIVEDTVDIAGKKYYTDESLTSMVAAQDLTPQQAYQHQQARMKAEIKDETIRELKGEDEKVRLKKEFEEDKKNVLDKYPHFDPNNPDHDPEDQLYKLASELWVESYRNNSKGLSQAISRAKQILRMSDQRPDVSDDLSVGRTRSSADITKQGEREVSLNADEKEAAIRMYGGIINPATNRNYTDNEAIVKATKAKTARMKR